MKYFKTKKELIDFFSKEYFTSVNYSDYLHRKSKYIDTALDIYDFFGLTKDSVILDYGCAVGHLLNGFSKLGITNLTGVDTSEWAIINSPYKNISMSTDISIISKQLYDLCIVLDVFEHMFDDQIDYVLSNLSAKKILVRIPYRLENETDFHLAVSRKDPSHVNCKTKEKWIEKLESFGYYYVADPIATKTIYNSTGCFCGYFIYVDEGK